MNDSLSFNYMFLSKSSAFSACSPLTELNVYLKSNKIQLIQLYFSHPPRGGAVSQQQCSEISAKTHTSIISMLVRNTNLHPEVMLKTLRNKTDRTDKRSMFLYAKHRCRNKT
ncbi:hypothetical protein ATANTOWER_024491 [Ataeniobius toweri]|uniref:Uncharacterized protein n=1 Tax=Ataeniobius toweri TaxID=208326 RepID=A0ABU7B4R9_9TELE|nr:hypothetical protein [Ataeniobius toweri]